MKKQGKKKNNFSGRVRTSVLLLILMLIAMTGGCLDQDDESVTETVESSVMIEESGEEDTTFEETEEKTTKAADTVEETTKDQETESETPAVEETTTEPETESQQTTSITLADIPAYSGSPYTEINDNQPFFTEADYTTEAFETYSSLDSLGRCGIAYANICEELMPTEERGAIGEVRPSGWHTVKYIGVVEDNYLYNRCHLIGYQLSGENANEKNLITGTHYLNYEGMLPWEDEVAQYVRRTDHHVLYRVTPLFDGDDLVARGVLMEAYSVEDDGAGICFNVFAYNVQPGVAIDYATGESELDGTVTPETEAQEAQTAEQGMKESFVASEGTDYILNTNSMKFHNPSCSSVQDMSAGNRKEYTGSRDELIAMGYEPCGRCKP